MPNLQGPAESRLLAVERRHVRIEDMLREMRRELAAVLQGLRDDEVTRRAPAGPAVVNDFAAICGLIPVTLTVHDPALTNSFGDCAIVYDAALGAWKGCKIVVYPGTLLCVGGSRSTAIWYTLTGSNVSAGWPLKVEWVQVIDPNGGQCPLAGTSCASTPNRSQTTTTALLCRATTTWNFVGAAQGSIFANSKTLQIAIP